ncbi:hypothetical protein [Zavarzinia aquatilis]|uniref:hypothetical protein n=1 Tax=Zavarzinia aquatilis TaxID=2211142 RepID=UPI001057CCF7|nr:hypothetical protein [Zavarzinia aquatilis]
MDSTVLPGLQQLIVIFLVIALMTDMGWLLFRARPAIDSAHFGTVRPHRGLIAFVLVLGLLLFGTASWGLLTAHRQNWAAAGVALFFGSIVAAIAPLLTAHYAIHWNEWGIEGPARAFSLRSRVPRRRLLWPEIARFGRTRGSDYFFESADGRRIYWNFTYSGWPVILGTWLRHRKPEAPTQIIVEAPPPAASRRPGKIRLDFDMQRQRRTGAAAGRRLPPRYLRPTNPSTQAWHHPRRPRLCRPCRSSTGLVKFVARPQTQFKAGPTRPKIRKRLNSRHPCFSARLRAATSDYRR